MLGTATKRRIDPARDIRAVPKEFRPLAPEHIKDHVSLNQFAA